MFLVVLWFGLLRCRKESGCVADCVVCKAAAAEKGRADKMQSDWNSKARTNNEE